LRRVERFDGLAAAMLSRFSAGVFSAGARGGITAFVVGALCAVVPGRCTVAPGGFPAGVLGMLRAIVFGVHSAFVLGAFSAGARGCVSAFVIGALRAVDPGLCTAARGGFPAGLPSSLSAALLDDLFAGLVVLCERQRWQRHQHKRGPDCDPSNSNHRNLLQEMKAIAALGSAAGFRAVRAAGGCKSRLRSSRLTQWDRMLTAPSRLSRPSGDVPTRGIMQRTPLILLTALLLAACGEEVPVEKPVTAAELIVKGPHPHAIIEIRDLGQIRIELLPEIAPGTVENFIKLAEDGFYEGIAFHRVIPGFMLQAGDPGSRGPDPRLVGGGGPGYAIQDEFSEFPHTRGVLSMANKGGRNSAGSQFFIVHQDSPHLDGRFTAFGRVVEGIEVVDAITEVEIDIYGRYGPTDRPFPVSVVIEAVRIERPGMGVAGN
jgi:peptidyl-prolyl cis-trans isomerase B (cyclophilin B)